MITETGKIIAIEQVEGETLARIECISKSACSSCHNKTNCGVGVVSKAFSDKSQYIEFPYQEGMKVDQFIELQISDGDLIKSAALIYLLPLFFFIGSSLLIKGLFDIDEIILIAISLLFSVFGFLITRIVASKLFPQKVIPSIKATQFDK